MRNCTYKATNYCRMSLISLHITQCATHFADPTYQIELIQRRAEEIRLERKEQAATAKPYGEQVRAPVLCNSLLFFYLSCISHPLCMENSPDVRSLAFVCGQTRIIIPSVFKHENGLATVDRPTEILMMTRGNRYRQSRPERKQISGQTQFDRRK